MRYTRRLQLYRANGLELAIHHRVTSIYHNDCSPAHASEQPATGARALSFWPSSSKLDSSEAGWLRASEDIQGISDIFGLV